LEGGLPAAVPETGVPSRPTTDDRRPTTDDRRPTTDDLFTHDLP
jgi:hypothetical protein